MTTNLHKNSATIGASAKWDPSTLSSYDVVTEGRVYNKVVRYDLAAAVLHVEYST